MSILPEVILQNLLVRGIQAAREDEYTLDILLRNMDQPAVASLKKVLKNTPIDITFNYPREDSQFPCIAILLKGENEEEPLIGDFIGWGYGPATIDGTQPVGSVARGSVGSSIREEFFFDKTGSATPDTSPITEPTQTIVGEARKLLNDDAVPKMREGTGFSVTYLLQVMTTHQEFTLFLYILIKFILIRNRLMLERNGLIGLTMAGTDFVPQPAFFPDFVFSRGLSIRFTNYFDYFIPNVEGLASCFGITLGVIDGDGIETPISVLSQPPSFTGLTPSSASLGVQTIIIATGTNIQREALLRFDDMPYSVTGPTGIEVLSTEYIDGNKLRVTIIPHSTGTTDVTLVNPDLCESTLENGLTVS